MSDRRRIWLAASVWTVASSLGFLLGAFLRGWWPPAPASLGQAVGWLFVLLLGLGGMLIGSLMLAQIMPKNIPGDGA